MKKSILVILGVLFIAAAGNIAFAKTATTNPQTASAIKLYKAGNYTQSYITFSDIVKKDPSNALAQYYLAMSAVQLGKNEEAITGYTNAMSLSPNGVLGSYAKRGLRCVEEPLNCKDTAVDTSDDTDEDKFIKGRFGSGFSTKARGVYEQQKIQNMMREINCQEDIKPSKFKEYKDFSSQAPTDEEIVSALRVLQQAGLGGLIGGNDYSDISSLMEFQSNSNNIGYDILNLLNNDNRGSNANLSPQVIQSLLTNQMTANF